MKRNIAILIVAVLASVSQGASGQENRGLGRQPAPAGVNDLPAMVEPAEADAAQNMVPQIPDPAGPYQGGAEPIAPPVAIDDAEPKDFVPGDTVRMLECQPALTESSGTWLRRGFWYAETDAVIFNRIWNADRLVLAGELTDLTQSPFGITNVPVANELTIDESAPAEGMPRLTLGKFLFRDESNRDHLAELTWFGGAEFVHEGQLDAIEVGDVNDGLQIPSPIDGSNPSGRVINNQVVTLPGNPTFDGAARMNYLYDSHLDSIELNYVVRDRMRRDRMVMKPDGRWVREAWPTRTLGFSAGVRFVNLRESLAWNASGIPDVNNDGTQERGRYFITTDNNLLGTQLGFTVARETSRWSIGLDTKFGGYWNPIDMNKSLEISGGVVDSDTGGDQHSLSMIGEASLIGKWHLTPRWSIRAGAEVLWIESIALAPHQIDFIAGEHDVIVDTGGAIFLGTSIGLESYW